MPMIMPDIAYLMLGLLIQRERSLTNREMQAELGTSVKKALHGMCRLGVIERCSFRWYGITERGRLAWKIEMARRDRLRAAGKKRRCTINVNAFEQLHCNPANVARAEKSHAARLANLRRRAA